ncbi:T9SS type A sorting domain-containing protein [Chryseobacterium polytrichastri]|uniref:Por secretion system C-terminal sorting domain-containing protein n=1 Tax=Chryseobacterium polytrichastri TaxID=1302687 RepID=A0A1M7C8C5_9FLAO|nr:T9SS type A sorting domain-containing protein [Chryseobacterium polytrichastri]SHL63532.1 Por secretion system C-terminal sorting domain-containing protein [Chryseobacterium polytrichastri]
MKKLLLTCLFFLIATFLNAQIVLGSGTTKGGYAPIDVNYGYNFTEQIFTKSEINSTAGNITGVKFYLSNTSDISKSVDWVVYVGHTTKTNFTSTSDWVPVSSLTQVFSGVVSVVAGEVTVTFATPFAYNNVDNLVLAIDENTPDFTATTNRFYTYVGAANSGLYFRSDTVNPDPFAPAAGERSNVKSLTNLLGLMPASAPACPVVSAPTAAATGVALLPTITWAAASTAASYKISVGTTPGGTDIVNMTDVGNVTSYTFTTALNYSTTYYYTVSATNVIGNSTGCAERTFTTVSVACPSVSAPTAAQTGLSVRPTFTWPTISGVTGYRLSIGTSAGANNILNNFDLGNVLTYTLTTAQQLTANTQYFYTVTAYSGNYSSTGCTERNFKTANAAIPANDECINAVTLTVNPDLACTATTAGNTLGATNSLAATPCFGNPDDDVWFKFTATSSTHHLKFSDIVSTGVISTTDMYVQVLGGACGALTSVICSDSDAITIVNGLTPGTIYYVRVYTYGGQGNNASFNICVGTPPAAPANDECSNAVTVAVNSDMNCSSVISGTTLSATNSSVAVSPCTGVADDDVWYKFTAVGTAHTIWLKNIVSVGLSSDTSLYAQVFSGTCGTLASIKCITSNTAYTSLTGLNPGGTYYVRVYNSNTNSTLTTYANTFDLCIGTLPPPPANDDCVNAVTVTVNPDLNCGSTTSGTTLSATNSGLAVTPCTGVADDDVWYKFTAVGASHTIWLKNVVSVGNSSSTSLYAQVFSGACGTLTSIKCTTSNTAYTTLTALTPGQTYYVRVYNSSANTTTSTYANTFDLCIGTLPPPPANDDCVNAVTVTVNPDINCGSITSGTTLSATNSVLAVTPCTGVADDDVWFKFTAVGASHTLWLKNIVSVGNSSSTSLYAQVFSGVCGTLTSMTCITSNTAYTSLTGLTPGQTYYVRVYNSNTNSATTIYANTFDLCIGTPPPPPANDECTGAVALTVGGNFSANAVIGTTVSATTDGTTTCQPNRANNVWYSVVVPASGSVTVETAAVTGSGFIDSVLSAHTGVCGALINAACNDDIATGNNFSKIALVGQTPGAVIYFSVWRYSSGAGVDGQFQISAYDASINLATSETSGAKNIIKVYPNPFVDDLNISDITKVKSVLVNDISGRLVKTIDNPGSSLHLGDLKSGMYLLTLEMKDGTRQSIKVIKR